MNQQDQQNRQGGGGSGSAENKDQARAAQMQGASPEQLDKDRIASEINSGPVPVAGIEETGALSGRDDASGGSGDGMENTSSGEGTEKL